MPLQRLCRSASFVSLSFLHPACTPIYSKLALPPLSPVFCPPSFSSALLRKAIIPPFVLRRAGPAHLYPFTVLVTSSSFSHHRRTFATSSSPNVKENMVVKFTSGKFSWLRLFAVLAGVTLAVHFVSVLFKTESLIPEVEKAVRQHIQQNHNRLTEMVGPDIKFGKPSFEEVTTLAETAVNGRFGRTDDQIMASQQHSSELLYDDDQGMDMFAEDELLLDSEAGDDRKDISSNKNNHNKRPKQPKSRSDDSDSSRSSHRSISADGKGTGGEMLMVLPVKGSKELNGAIKMRLAFTINPTPSVTILSSVITLSDGTEEYLPVEA